jgi:hypothetical protein
MKTYQLVRDPLTGQITLYARELIEGVFVGVMVHTTENQEYLRWVEAGGVALPPEETP